MDVRRVPLDFYSHCIESDYCCFAVGVGAGEWRCRIGAAEIGFVGRTDTVKGGMEESEKLTNYCQRAVAAVAALDKQGTLEDCTRCFR